MTCKHARAATRARARSRRCLLHCQRQRQLQRHIIIVTRSRTVRAAVGVHRAVVRRARHATALAGSQVRPLCVAHAGVHSCQSSSATRCAHGQTTGLAAACASAGASLRAASSSARALAPAARQAATQRAPAPPRVSSTRTSPAPHASRLASSVRTRSAIPDVSMCGHGTAQRTGVSEAGHGMCGALVDAVSAASSAKSSASASAASIGARGTLSNSQCWTQLRMAHATSGGSVCASTASTSACGTAPARTSAAARRASATSAGRADVAAQSRVRVVHT